MSLKKGDNVIVISGKDKGKQGKVARVFRDRDRVSVEGVNFAKRRIKPKRSGEKGQVVEVSLPLHISNVLIYCDKCKKGVRQKSDIKKGKKVRICVKCSKQI